MNMPAAAPAPAEILARQRAAEAVRFYQAAFDKAPSTALALRSFNAAFLAGAKARGLLNLKGHKSAGGMRASIYNAMPIEGVQALVDYMRDFEQRQA